MLLCWRLLGGVPRVLSARWPSSKVNLCRLSGPGMWPKREFTVCHTHQLRVHMRILLSICVGLFPSSLFSFVAIIHHHFFFLK
jgi:hypothetical protein